MPLKIINGFQNITKSPLLVELLDNAKKNSKGLECTKHPKLESRLKLSLKDGKINQEWDVCCEEFKKRAVYQLSFQGSLDRQNNL
jgi:hypothetical protein